MRIEFHPEGGCFQVHRDGGPRVKRTSGTYGTDPNSGFLHKVKTLLNAMHPELDIIKIRAHKDGHGIGCDSTLILRTRKRCKPTSFVIYDPMHLLRDAVDDYNAEGMVQLDLHWDLTGTRFPHPSYKATDTKEGGK